MVINQNSDNLKKEILKVVKRLSIPISTQDLSIKLNKPWHSVQTRCLMLQVDGKINGFRIGRINLWQKK